MFIPLWLLIGLSIFAFVGLAGLFVVFILFGSAFALREFPFKP